MIRYLLLIFFLLLPSLSMAATHYASPSGTDTWANSTNISTPCSLETARTNADAGDTVLLRGGTYTISSTWMTVNAGTGDPDNQRIIFKAYTGETPELVSNGLGNTIMVEDSYWTFDGLTITASNMTDHDHGVIRVGENGTGNYVKIINCTIELVSSAGHDNIACISLQANRSNYAYIYKNLIIGVEPGSDYNCGIQYLGGGNVGTKILNNEIKFSQLGIMVKHANGDSSLGAAQIKYNYIHDCTYGIYGQPTYIEIEHNITNFMLFGDNGGGAQGSYSLFNHNTVHPTSGVELWDPSEGPINNCTFTNNIFPTKTTYGDTESENTWDYNMYGDDAAIGANDLGTTTPTYTGGSNPSTIAGFLLTAESDGKGEGSGGSDMGADVTLVGINPSGGGSSPPNTPTVDFVEINDETFGSELIWQDDFESSNLSSDYSDYNAGSGTALAITTDEALSGTKSVNATWSSSQVDAGSFQLFFGTMPSGVTSKARNGEDFSEVYIRFYLRLSDGWIRNPVKLMRIYVMAESSWSQAMVAHMWGVGSDTNLFVTSDPASGTSGGVLQTDGWNDTSNFEWLGVSNGTEELYGQDQQWRCVEMYVKLNSSGSADGIVKLWIDGTLDINHTGLDFIDTWTGFGLNAVLFGNYWNQGAAQAEERYMDNLVISTQYIGLAKSPLNPVVTKTDFSDDDADPQIEFEAEISTSAGVGGKVWAGSKSGTGNTITVNTTDGTFEGALLGQISLAGSTTYYARVRQSDGEYSSWSDWKPFLTKESGELPKLTFEGISFN